MSTLTSDNLRSKMMHTSAEQSSLHLRSGSSVGSSSSSRANSVAHHNRSSPDHSSTITEVSRSSTPAISQFDQSYADSNTIDIDDLASLDPSSTVIDGKISFVLGCTRQPLKHVFKTSPAFANPKMASNYLTAKIDNFLKNTDHPVQEWQQNTSTAKANIKRILRGTPEPSCNDSDDNRTIADDGDWDEVNETASPFFQPPPLNPSLKKQLINPYHICISYAHNNIHIHIDAAAKTAYAPGMANDNTNSSNYQQQQPELSSTI